MFRPEEYSAPIEKLFRGSREGREIIVLVDDMHIVVMVEGDDGTWGREKKYATELVDRFEEFAEMVAMIFAADFMSVRDISYGEKEGEPIIPLYERVLNSMGFGYD